MRSARHARAFFAVIGVDDRVHPARRRVGFLIVAPLVLFAMFIAFGVGRGTAVIVAVVGTLVIWYAFYKLLRVPLSLGRARALRVLTPVPTRIARGERPGRARRSRSHSRTRCRR